MPLDQLTLTVGGLGWFVCALLGVVKGFLPSKIDGTTQDNIVRTLSFVFGILGSLANYFANTTHPTNQGVEGALGIGFGAANWAFVTYHTYNGDIQTILTKAITPNNTTNTILIPPRTTNTPN